MSATLRMSPRPSRWPVPPSSAMRRSCRALLYTEAILETALRLGIASSLVANGVYLRHATPLLCRPKPMRIGFSLDAAHASRHDKLRGVTGAWRSTVDAIRASISDLGESGTELSQLRALMHGSQKIPPALLLPCCSAPGCTLQDAGPSPSERC